jgi:hypothetical protein|tara:strand:- start:243 stop:410 length:168 start_codon:yes stop_codon:yes gene_type:complete
MSYPNHLIDYDHDPDRLQELKDTLYDAGLEYMIMKRDGALVQLNVWIGKPLKETL